ncbi:MAG: tetratricopeptide repeat protein [Burkholderiaceae bacterium]
MTSFKALAVAVLFSSVAPAVWSAPRIPLNDAEVIEYLPRRADPAQQEFRALRSRLAASPDNMPLALTLARSYISQSRVEGDPRYLGYAQAALAPWYDKTDPPTEIRVMRATLLQSTHQFPASLRDLDAVLTADPHNAQAWLTRATVLQVTGEFARATQSCNALRPLAPTLITITCLSNVASLNGQARQSYVHLKSALAMAPDVDPGIHIWVTTLLAEMAERLGEFQAAEEHFKTALAVDDADSYLLGAYADFLLDQKRSGEVIRLLKDQTRVDALLLRYTLALALKANDSRAAADQIAVLNARFAAAMLRGDTVHQREQARFELQLMHRAPFALQLAQRNWAVQKEPADVRVLLEAALAANDKAAAAPVLDWLKKTRLEDHAINALAAKFTAGV